MSLKRLSHKRLWCSRTETTAPGKAAVVSVLEHHKHLCDNLFKDIVTDPSHKLYNLLKRPDTQVITNAFLMLIEHLKTNRAMRSFVPSMCNINLT